MEDLHAALQIAPAREAARLEDALRAHLGEDLRRRGFVVAMSGGVDSSVCAALAARAVGPARVLGLLLPERESDPQDGALARSWAARVGVPWVEEDITPVLEAAGCYARRDAAIRKVVPQYGAGWRCKLTIRSTGTLSVFYVTVRSPTGETSEARLSAESYREIVAATSFKQRVRKMFEYHHADRLHYAVLGTPNRLEYDQGFFVKGGDGLADVKPIAHLYKSQVYQLAAHYGVPAEISERPSTTGTFSLPQTQGEFYFTLEPRELDLVLYAMNAGLPATEPARVLGRPAEEIEAVYRDVERKRAATRYLHLAPLLAGPVPEVG